MPDDLIPGSEPTFQSARMSEIEDKFAKAVALMLTALSHSTGLKDRDQRLVTYWTLATHALPHLDTFPPTR